MHYIDAETMVFAKLPSCEASVKRCKLTFPSIVLACDVEEGDELIVYMEK